MSRGNTDAVPPQEPGRNRQSDFGPHQFENGARRIEQGIASGQGTQALHEELNLMREAAMKNGSFNLAQYQADVKAIDAQLHKDGFLPHVHLDVDGQGHDIVRRGGADRGSEAAPESPGSPHGGRGRSHGRGRRHGGHGGGHGGRHHRRGHHGRGGGEARAVADGGEQGGDQGPEQVSGGETLTDQEMRPDGRANNGGLQDFRADASANRLQGDRGQPGDRTQPGADRMQQAFNADPGKDRSNRGGEPSLWGAPTISAAGIDKVLRDNRSPAAGMGAYIYDQSVAHGINPAFALAMYGQESTFGTKGAAVRNHSFGNIRDGRHGYKHYGDLKEGIDDWMRLMDNYRGKSLAGFVHKYAPGSDGNNTGGYMRYIASNMNKWSRMGDGNGDVAYT
ncbi:MAG TPA: hypothetical protein V6C89_17170 [Drouetiella sp.]|jgi:hypothetical protein